MRSTLIFKNIHEENKLTWKDTARVPGHFISKVLDMNYSYEKLDMFISRAHRDNQHSSKSHHKGPTPLQVSKLAVCRIKCVNKPKCTPKN